MESALVVSTNEKIASILAETLLQLNIIRIITVTTAGEARRLLIERDYDLCVVNSPLIDETGENLARNIASKGISQVLLLVRSEFYNEISHHVEDYGVITVAKPVNRDLLWSALKVAQAAHKKLQIVQNENKLLLQKIEEIRIIDRAKCILISHFSMSEPEAHRCIEKQSMDMRTTKRAVAEEILKTYEN
ncbi:MAG: response regulator [Clostridia bacterium]|nr:response regulator [Clostridia bacterium]